MFWNKVKQLFNRCRCRSYHERTGEHVEECPKYEEPKHEDGKLYCPNCGGDQWYEGPSGGMATNIKCANCGIWFNSTPFGLDFIGVKTNIGETSRKMVWYCPKCKATEDTTQTSEIFKYPHCKTCNTPLKICWTYKDFPKKFCDTCDARFKCFTMRGNW